MLERIQAYQVQLAQSIQSPPRNVPASGAPPMAIGYPSSSSLPLSPSYQGYLGQGDESRYGSTRSLRGPLSPSSSDAGDLEMAAVVYSVAQQHREAEEKKTATHVSNNRNATMNLGSTASALASAKFGQAVQRKTLPGNTATGQ